MSDVKDGILRRSISIRLDDKQPEDANRVRIVASTDDEVDMGGYREKLYHDESSIDRSGAASALFNHDRNQVIGGIVSTSVSGGKMTAELDIDPEARGSNGLRILHAIRKGYLRGVSVGYSYRTDDCEITEDDMGNVRVVARRWTLREISITPTPADLSAGVLREAPEFVRAFKAHTEAARMSTEVKVPANAEDEIKKAREAEEMAKRELQAERELNDTLELVRGHGVNLSREEVKGKSRAEVLTLALERKASANVQKPEVNTSVDVVRDSQDKANEAASDALSFMAGIKNDKNQGMRSGSFLDIGRRWLTASGLRNVVDLDRRQLAAVLLGKGPGMREAGQLVRSAANITSGMFTTYLLANVMDKVIYGGFNTNDSVITYTQWVKQRQVQDFKTYSGAALDVGNLVETAENTAFPELAKDEGGYSDALSMWGATHSLTYQAIVNDDLGQFMEKLGMAGFIARRTVDKKVYAVVEAATWTSATTTGNLTEDNLNIVRNKLSLKTGPAGEVLGYDARFLIVPTGLRQTALKITTVPQIVNDNIKVNTDLIPIITPFLTTKTTAANSEYYIAAPTMFDPCVVATLAGVESPIVEEYDAGAVAARKWKIMYPFKVTVPTVSSVVQAMWNGSGS